MKKEGMPKKDKRKMTERFKEIRNNLGISQERFAEELDVSVSAIKKIELGENGISKDMLWKLNQKFGVSADYMLFGKKADEEQAWEAFLNISETDKTVFLFRLFTYCFRTNYILNDKSNEKIMDTRDIEKILEKLQGRTYEA